MFAVISGKESSYEPATPLAALVDFYRAFNQRDIQAMAHNWFDSETASMSNPLGGIKRGWNEIGSVYQNIFSGPAQVYVEFYDFSIYQTEKMFCAVGRERGYFQIAETTIDLAIRTSRIYLSQQGRWQQIHHHGSIEQADLLDRYQSTVFQRAYS